MPWAKLRACVSRASVPELDSCLGLVNVYFHIWAYLRMCRGVPVSAEIIVGSYECDNTVNDSSKIITKYKFSQDNRPTNVYLHSLSNERFC